MANLLLVDDDKSNLEVMEFFLSDEEYWLTFAYDGQEAWDLLDEDPEGFDGVILDRIMPNMDGMETLKRIHADPRFINLPVIMQTCATEANEVAEGLAAGAWYYLTKPYNRESLESVIHIALEEREHRLELLRLGKEMSDITKMIDQASFRFRTLVEVRELASMLSRSCYNANNIAMGLSELMVNAVEHGNLGIDFQQKRDLIGLGSWQQEIQKRLESPEYGSRYAHIDVKRKGDLLEFVICDQGNGFDWRPFLEFDESRADYRHGRGIATARKMAFPSLCYQGNGNTVIATAAAFPRK